MLAKPGNSFLEFNDFQILLQVNLSRAPNVFVYGVWSSICNIFVKRIILILFNP